MNTKPIYYGLKNGEIVNISDVERGLACGCTCLECGAKLEAHQGEKNIYHFKHHNSEERINCYETAIHLASKKLFSIKKTVLTPDLYSSAHNVYEEKVKSRKTFKIIKVYEEYWIEDFRPDLYLEVSVTHEGVSHIVPLIVEIAVTHFIDEIKLAKIKKVNISAIEISLSKLERITNDDTLWEALNNHDNIKWLHNRNINRHIEKKRENDILHQQNTNQMYERWNSENKKSLNNLWNEGFELLKIYDGRKVNTGYTVDEYTFSGEIYCVKDNNKKIDRTICEKCEFNHGSIRDNSIDAYRMICGFNINRKSK